MATDAWGVDDGYLDAAGVWHGADPDTVTALHAAMGADGRERPPAGDPVRIVHPGRLAPLAAPAVLTLEDGTELRAEGTIPADLPLGYHDLRLDGHDRSTRLIVAPARCHLPDRFRAWGMSVQLYAARSRASWGMGDLADLRALADWTRERGAHVLAVNPLHAPANVGPQEPSPYFPSSRRWWNPLYIRVEEVPGAVDEPELAALAAAGRALNHDRRIDRDAVHALKLDALERLWRRFPGEPVFDRFVEAQGADLTEFATFSALAEHHRSHWRAWPEEHRSPAQPGVGEFTRQHHDRVRFHCWLQWLIDQQLAAADADQLLIADLAVGVDPCGADAWSDQDVLALDVGVGAPPDRFNTRGQDWGLPPFVPWRLREAAYEPFVRNIRAGMRRAKGIRIDHVMSLFRLFWILAGTEPTAGSYVRFAGDDLMDIVALESVRSGAFVVGEDLGTVEAEVRDRLLAAGALSYRLVWFEPGDPEEYPEQALAAVTTHDLPTVAGLWSGADLDAQRRLDLRPDEAATADMRAHLAALTGADDSTPIDDIVLATHRRLAAAPSMVVTATLDDLLAVEERPNMPGTRSEWPNWSIALPCPIDDLPDQPLAGAVIDALASRVRDTP